MAVTYNNTKHGRAGGPNPALIKEYTTLSTVCKGDPGDLSVVLIDASAQPGGTSESYYLIWGVTAVTMLLRILDLVRMYKVLSFGVRNTL